MNRRRVTLWWGCCVLAAMLGVRLVSAQSDAEVAMCRSGSVEVDSLRSALAQNVQSLDTRLKLADALLEQACYAEAVQVLEDGERLYPRNGRIQAKLRDARSMLSEQHYFNALDRAEQSAKAERNVLRCRKLGDLPACDAALRERPDDAELLIGKADALVHSHRPSEALPLYRRAAGLTGAPRDIQEKIAAAESQRQSLVVECESGAADAALRACQLALLPGASDEFVVERRRGVLLQGMGQPSQALDAYIAASRVRSDDEVVSQAIVALTDSTGRKDAVALAARGNALLYLKRGAEAVQAFQGARALSPGLPDIEAPLAAAEELARSEVPKSVPRTAVRSSGLPPVAEPVALPPAVEAPDPMLALEARRTYSNNDPVTRSH